MINEGEEKTNENDELSKVLQDIEATKDTGCEDLLHDNVPNLMNNKNYLQSLEKPPPPLTTTINASSKRKKEGIQN